MRWFGLVALALMLVTSSARASDRVIGSPLTMLRTYCNGQCAATIYGGMRLKSGLHRVVPGMANFVAPWNYEYGDSGIVAGSLSRAFLTSKYGSVEFETGVGQRFGSMRETEFWFAIYGRWSYFPWNGIVRTSFAVSTGLNYATGISLEEIDHAGTGQGSRVLHYFSPEFTFGLPSHPNIDFVIRYHHRSGGGRIWGHNPLFKGVEGGMEYLVGGIRHRF